MLLQRHESATQWFVDLLLKTAQLFGNVQPKALLDFVFVNSAAWKWSFSDLIGTVL